MLQLGAKIFILVNIHASKGKKKETLALMGCACYAIYKCGKTSEGREYMEKWGVFTLWLSLSLAMAALIFWFSSQPGEESDQVSLSLTNQLLDLVQHEDRSETLLRIADLLVRKAAHFAIYAALGVCIYGTARQQQKVPATPLAIVLGAVYAATDEFHQSFVPGRVPAVHDVLLDTCGAAAGCILMMLIFRRMERRKQIRCQQ